MADLSEQVKAEMKELFNMFDKDQNGHITTDEVGTVMRGLGQNPTKHDIEDMMKLCDNNGNGTVEYEEFCEHMATRFTDPDARKETLRDAFKVFDKNGDGFVEFKELKHVMTNLGDKMTDEEIKEMITEADVNDDGKVSYEEFVTMMSS